MKRLLTPVLIAVASAVFAALLTLPLAPVERAVSALHYSLRSDERADSNIVLIYIDNDAIRELGYPVRRNFYALMVNALTELRATVIGIDVLFENPSLEYPEYDQLLAHIVQRSDNVVLSGYFETIDRTRLEDAMPKDGLTDFPFVVDPQWYGSGLHLPMPPLVAGAEGIGHENLTAEGTFPLFVWRNNQPVPVFGLEMLRAYAGADRRSVRYEKDLFAVKHQDRLIEISAREGVVTLNYPTSISSFTAYPFLKVLTSYDALRSERTPSVPVQLLKNKIVLIGVMAEGRAETFATPTGERFPALALHAVFLDNALRSGFLRTVPLWVVMIGVLIFAFVCAVGAGMRSPANVILPAAMLFAVVVLSIVMFRSSAISLPLVPFLIAGIAAIGGSLMHKHRFLQRQVRKIQSEKERIAAELFDREAKVDALERELMNADGKRPADRTSELLEEIRRYKAEIHELSSRKDDMEEADVVSMDSGQPGEFEEIVYETGGAMQTVIDFAGKIAESDATVLILGESGTGKELVARAIHKRSKRKEKPFVAVNCGALAETLLESELFGHERGAFTGAVKDKLGRFELADGGTIFLDEIGEVNEVFQLKLLRVLQEGEFERVGGTKTVRVDVRVIAATNKNLKQRAKEGKFREDLYFRLNVLSVELPPLRDRQGDIPLLINHFLQKDGSSLKLSRNVMDTLQQYSWPGNIRELESAVTRAILLAKADKRSMISMKDLSDDIAAAAKGTIAIEDQVLESLREKGFSRSAITETADELGGLNRGTVAEYLRGQCLKAFVEHTYNLDVTVRHISLSSDKLVNDRVRKKLKEYLANIAEAVSQDEDWDVLKPSLKSKMKNLPQKYHPYLEKVAEAYYRRVWRLEVE